MSIVQKIWSKAARIAKEPNRLKRVVSKAGTKLNNLEDAKQEWKQMKSTLAVFRRMISSQLSGADVSFSRKTMLFTTFALVYFITPTDLIPDFVPALGFTDDLSVILFVYKQLKADISKFVEWEQVN